MPSFSRPRPDFNYDLANEKAALDSLFARRNVPRPRSGRLLLASWNIANLETQITRFYIYRRPMDADEDSVLVSTVDPNERMWHDEFAEVVVGITEEPAADVDGGSGGVEQFNHVGQR